MASLVNIGGSGNLFVGEDKSLPLELVDSSGVPVDMTGWTIRFLVVGSNGALLIDKTASITGSYSATRAGNTQRAVVALTDTDLSIQEGVHRHSWKRTDDGSETILAYGNCTVERATQT